MYESTVLACESSELEELRAEVRRLRRVEAELRAGEERLRTLVENIPEYLFIKNRNLVYVVCNDLMARNFDLTPYDIFGKTDFDLYPRDRAERNRERDRRIMQTGVGEESVQYYTLRGRLTTIQLRKLPLRNDQGQIWGIIGMFHEVHVPNLTQQAGADPNIRTPIPGREASHFGQTLSRQPMRVLNELDQTYKIETTDARGCF